MGRAEDVDTALDVTGADDVLLRDVLVTLDVLLDDPLLELEEVALEFTVLVTVVLCDLVVLELVIMESSEVRSPLEVRREEVVCNGAELWLDDERRELIAVWLDVEEVLKPDVVGSTLTDSTKDGVKEEVTEVAELWVICVRWVVFASPGGGLALQRSAALEGHAVVYLQRGRGRW